MARLVEPLGERPDLIENGLQPLGYHGSTVPMALSVTDTGSMAAANGGENDDLSFNDDLIAVVAHSLLNSMSVIAGNAETLAEHWERIDPETRAQFLDRIVTQSAHVVGVLTDLVRSGRPELVEALERLQGL
jgi:signal transduction histidine kinase